MAVNLQTNASRVRVSSEKTEAYLTLSAPGPGEEYEISDLRDILEKYGVVYGIKRDALKRILEKNVYHVEYLVAEGTHAIHGRDGQFQFLFNQQQDNKPKILRDGSVDYTSMAKLEIVEEGQEIVHYTPAKQGQDGIDVKGNIIKAHLGRELIPLKGKGFTLSEDKTTYTANVCGRVEYKNDRLVVSNTLVIEEDVTRVTGDVLFRGDVLLRGTVITGMKVQATGDITVDGYVEAATLEAGGNVILKNGMQGGGKGEITAGKDVSGKFFEQTTICCKGDVNANALLNCNIISEGHISVSGRLGVLVGGSASAVKGIDATVIGNMSEIKMHINLGTDFSIYTKLSGLEETIQSLKEEIDKLNTAMKQIGIMIEKRPNADLSQKKMDIMRAKIAKDSQLIGLTDDVRRITEIIENAADAKLVVQKNIYRGSRITINGVTKNIEVENYNCTYREENGEIICVPNI